MSESLPPADGPGGLKRLRYAKASLPGDAKSGAARQRAEGVHSRGYLPHIKVPGAVYFVTFRLADSIPEGAASRMKAEIEDKVIAGRERWKNRPGRKASETEEPFDESGSRQRSQFAVMERWLNAGHGKCWLARHDVAEMVNAALLFFAGERYDLKAWCVMPNHVHAVVRPRTNWALSKILHSWKSFTAKEAVNLIGEAAPVRFWMPETYDHWCRDEGEIERCSLYTRMNPVKAKLCREISAWPWAG